MNYLRLDREKLIDWLGGRLQADVQEGELPWHSGKLPSNEVFIVSPPRGERTDLPVIAVPQEGMREFFAFVSTYAANLRPLSAFYHVVAIEQLQLVLAQEKRRQFKSMAIDKLIGVSFAEAFVNASGRLRSLSDLSVVGVKATLSASLMNAVINAYPTETLTDISDRWNQARRLTGQTSTAVPSEDVLAVWQSISEALDHSSVRSSKTKQTAIVRALADALTDGIPFEAWFEETIRRTLGAELNLSSLRGAREERVRSLPRILEQLFLAKIERDVADFIAGGLLSMIGNGSMGHLGLLESVSKNRPRAALWFGAMSTFHPQSDILSTANCLGQRVLRDIREGRSVFGVPESDIQVEELEVIGDKAFGDEGIRTGHSGTVVVGLLGAVNGWFRSPNGKRDEPQRTSAEEQQAILLHERARLEELQFLLDRAVRIAHEIRQPRQRELFDRSGSEPRKRR